ncbi:MAG: hypothetical protein RBS68_08890 [Anaerolineales bacterium]|jgi:antagonist of KipI|nr:hypothetical protein [Anaerolineales bacterium]
MLELIQPALLTTVQDAGRYGWQAWGVPRSGSMDALALAAANRLAGVPGENRDNGITRDSIPRHS